MTPRSPHTAVHTLQRATPALFCPPPPRRAGQERGAIAVMWDRERL